MGSKILAYAELAEVEGSSSLWSEQSLEVSRVTRSTGDLSEVRDVFVSP